MREILKRGLLLPFKLHLQPYAFGQEVAALAPEYPADYSLWQVRFKLRQPAFRADLAGLLTCSAVALLWALVLTLLVLAAFSAWGYDVQWSRVWVGVAYGAMFGVTYGVAGGVASGLAAGVAAGVMGGVTAGVALGLAYGLAGAVVRGVVGGVAGGVVLGVAIGLASGVTLGVTGGVWEGVRSGLVAALISGVAGGLVFGAAFGVASGVASAVVGVLAVTHCLVLPFEVLVSMGSTLLLRFRPLLARPLWRISPVRWDEVILLLLPGLEGLLLRLYESERQVGREALVEVAAHRYQYRVAHKVCAKLACEEAWMKENL